MGDGQKTGAKRELAALRKRVAESEAREREHEFTSMAFGATAQALLEAASEGIVIVEPAGRILGVNRKAEEMFGYRREELIGRPVETLLPERFRSGHVAHRVAYFSEPRVRPMGRGIDLAGLRKDGSEFPAEISLSYTRSGDGLVAMAFITDITQRKQAERRVEAQFAVTEALAESASLDDAISGILRALCECLGWELGEMWSLDPESSALRWKGSWHVPGLDASELESISGEMTFPAGTGLLGRVLASDGPIWIADLVSAAPPEASSLRAIAAAKIGLHAAVAFPILIERRITGIMVLFSREIRRPDEDLLKMMADIGSRIGQYVEHRRVQEELQRQREAVSQSEKLAAIGTLSAGLAHEINNPLGIITARIDVMLEDADAQMLPSEVKEDLVVLRRNAHRVARIAQGLLSFARQSPAGERVVVDLNQIVDETLLLVEKQASREGIALVRELAPDLPPILGSPNQLQQVLLNLVNNAREAMPAGGTISVATERVRGSSGGARLRVSDTGPGIPPEQIPKLFDPFFTTKPGGTGLGLSVTYGIVKDHEGRLQVETAVGKGSHFIVTLPAIAEGTGTA